MDPNILFGGCSAHAIILFVFNFILHNCSDKLALIPVNVFVAHYYTWNLITSCFYERNFIKLLLELIIIYQITRKITIRNSEMFMLYFGSTILVCTFLTTIYCFTRFFSTRMESMIFDPIYGLSGVIICLTTYARQQLKNETVVIAFPFITYHNLPIVFISLQIVLWIVGLGQFAVDLPFSIVSVLYSWSYLRFYYRHLDNTSSIVNISSSSNNNNDPSGASGWGDMSDDFRFISMFPHVLHPVAVPFTTAFYNLVALTGLYPQLESSSSASGSSDYRKGGSHHLRYNEPSSSSGVNNGSTIAQDANDIILERRRAKAIKLLDAKMAELAKEADDGWDTTAVTSTSGTGGVSGTSSGDIETVTDSTVSGSSANSPFTIVINKH